jgi:hypothetical protein
MDDIAHQSIPLHSLPRKRKADSEDPCDSTDISCSQPSPSIHQLAPNPSKLPAPLSVQTNTASLHWPPEDGPSANNSPLSPASSSPTSPLKPDSPSRTKRPRIDDHESSMPASPKSRKKLEPKRVQDIISALESLKGDWRWITYPSGETRLAASWPPELGKDTPSLAELCPTSPTSPTGSLPSPSRIVIPIDPCSPHIPVRNPPINKDTLKELDLEAILRNPQLRAFPYLFPRSKAPNPVAPTHQDTTFSLTLAFSFVPPPVDGSGNRQTPIGRRC